MKPKIKLYFTDFWPVFNIEKNYFTELLSERFEIEISPENPDYIIYSVFGTDFLRYNCTRIFYTGENVRADFRDCDWAFTYDFSKDPRHYRLPLYPLFGDIMQLTLPRPDPEQILRQKTNFCNFIYSNASNKTRMDFFTKLNAIKKVDSAGRLLNNTNKKIENKLDFIKSYKFTIAFENESYPGYTTEKIFEPMLVNSVPIYWGNPLIGEDFNTKSFLNYHDFENERELIERIIEIDGKDELYMEMLSETFFKNNIPNKYVDPNNILDKFVKIFNTDIEPVALSTPTAKQGIARESFLRKRDALYKICSFKRKFDNFNLHKIKVKIQKMKEKKDG